MRYKNARKIKSRKTVKKKNSQRKGDKCYETNEKIMAVLLAAIMTMAMAVTALAADVGTKTTGTNKLTVNVKSGEGVPAQTLKDQTINLYKLFDVTESKSGETTNYAYTVNDTYKAALASVLSITETSKDEEFAAEVTGLGANNSVKVQQFANDFTAYALKIV